jgi:hypothetical protein
MNGIKQRGDMPPITLEQLQPDEAQVLTGTIVAPGRPGGGRHPSKKPLNLSGFFDAWS